MAAMPNSTAMPHHGKPAVAGATFATKSGRYCGVGVACGFTSHDTPLGSTTPEEAGAYTVLPPVTLGV
jgi:hypothetical protein